MIMHPSFLLLVELLVALLAVELQPVQHLYLVGEERLWGLDEVRMGEGLVEGDSLIGVPA